MVASPIRSVAAVDTQPNEADGRLTVVANRLPGTLAGSGDNAAWTPSVGGLATGLRSVTASRETVWIGRPGSRENIDERQASALLERLAASRTIPVRLNRDQIAVYYEENSNGVLWPVFHDRLDQAPLHTDGWEVYEAVNGRFADAIAAVWQPNAAHAVPRRRCHTRDAGT